MRKAELKWTVEETEPEYYLIDGVTRVRGRKDLLETLQVSMEARLQSQLP